MERDLKVKYLTSIVLSENESKLRKKGGVSPFAPPLSRNASKKRRILA
jgi:hypothetical protein